MSERENLQRRKQAEEALRKTKVLLERVFDTTEFMIAYLDTDFNFIRVNRAYAEADERTPEFFVGKNHFDLYPKYLPIDLTLDNNNNRLRQAI